MLPLVGAVVAGLVTVSGVQVMRLRQRSSPSLVSHLHGTIKTDSPLPPHLGTEQLEGEQGSAMAVKAVQAAPDDPARQRRLILSSLALGTTCAGHFFLPPLGILTTPLIVYLEWPMFQTAWRDLTEKRTVKLDGLMALFSTGAWLTRAYVSSALNIFVWFLSETLTKQTRWRLRHKSGFSRSTPRSNHIGLTPPVAILRLG